MIAKEYPDVIASQMAEDDVELAEWLKAATFAEASSGHWLAWHGDQPDRIAVLSPNAGPDDNRHWLNLGDSEGLDVAIARVESGEFDAIGVSELNMYVSESTASLLLPVQHYADIEIARTYLQSFCDGDADFGNPDQILERLELIHERYGEGELKLLFAQAAEAYKSYALRVTANLFSPAES